MKRALMLVGGWAGHDPEGVANLLGGCLTQAGFFVDIARTPDCFEDEQALRGYDLIVPCWSQDGKYRLRDELAIHVADAVEAGVGIAGCHGGMCDAFRENAVWQFLTGAQWVSHPAHPFWHASPVGNPPKGAFDLEYRVEIEDHTSPITRGMDDFSLVSEQYYLHLDPAVHVLASTRVTGPQGARMPHLAGGDVRMPVAYTRLWGQGRVFYCALGHDRRLFESCPQALEIMRRGMLWAARGLCL